MTLPAYRSIKIQHMNTLPGKWQKRCLKKISSKDPVQLAKKNYISFNFNIVIFSVYRNYLKTQCLFSFNHTNDVLCQTYSARKVYKKKTKNEWESKPSTLKLKAYGPTSVIKIFPSPFCGILLIKKRNSTSHFNSFIRT